MLCGLKLLPPQQNLHGARGKSRHQLLNKDYYNAWIGANAVLSPGTLLRKNTIVRRLQLIEQDNELN